MPSQLRYPANTTAGVWIDPNECKSLDGVFAFWPVDILPGNFTEDLVSNFFNFSIPSNATITGVKVTLDQLLDYNALGADSETFRVYLNSLTNLKTQFQYYDDGGGNIGEFGGPTDLWGYAPGALTPAIVNNSASFYVSWNMENTSGLTRSLAIDAVSIEVFYTEPNSRQKRFLKAGTKIIASS